MPIPPKDGWIFLDKPKEMSSARATGKIKYLLRIKKAGHVGTLDPFATGLLPIAVGEATKAIPYASLSDKRYRFQVRWGEQRTTDDEEGDVTETHDYRPTEAEIRAVLQGFQGEILQTPPIYSALKIKGVPSYRLARQGKVVTPVPRRVMIYGLELIAVDDHDLATFEVSCGPGTYVRSLARDMALALGTRGYVYSLVRTRIGKFTLQDAISLESLVEISHKDREWHCVLAPSIVLDDIPAMTLGLGDAAKIRQGQAVSVESSLDETDVTIWSEGMLLAVAFVRGGVVSPKRVFHLKKED